MARRTYGTYSIVACDLDAGQWGVAVQSKFLAVGSVVPWAEPYVGAIATQAYANPRYGPEGLTLLRDGMSAEDAVARLTAADEGREHCVEVDPGLAAELSMRLARLGYEGELADALFRWAGNQNLEERVDGAGQIDPVVLEELRGKS